MGAGVARQGIPENYLSEIFDAFFQVKQSTTEQELGLGLSIVQKVLELLGPPPDVRSRPGYGSVFFLAVPLRGNHVLLNFHAFVRGRC